jgi:hypothetical protein
MKNWVYEIIEDSLTVSLEENSWLPSSFSLTIDDDAFVILLKDAKIRSTGQKAPLDIKSIKVRIHGREVTVNSDKADLQLPALRDDTLH